MSNTPPTIYNARNLEQVNDMLRDIGAYIRRELARKVVLGYSSNAFASIDENNTHVRFDCTFGNLTYSIDEPLPVGWRVDMSKVDSSAHTLTVTGTGVTINDPTLGSVASVVISTQFESLTLVCVAPLVFDIV